MLFVAYVVLLCVLSFVIQSHRDQSFLGERVLEMVVARVFLRVFLLSVPVLVFLANQHPFELFLLLQAIFRVY